MREHSGKRRRTEAEFSRVYGSLDRIHFIRDLGCIVCGVTPAEQAHVASGGMGRKADYWQIVPLCPIHHRESHRIGAKTFGIKYALDLHDEAARTERDWQRHLRDTFGTLTKP